MIAKERLTLTQLFATLAIGKNDPEALAWIKRRFAVLRDILRESPAYQDIFGEGWEGGREEGRGEGRLLGLRSSVFALIKKNFPKLKKLALGPINDVEDPDVLEALFMKLLSAKNEQEALVCLMDVSNQQSGDD